jgi:hypothetical protein
MPSSHSASSKKTRKRITVPPRDPRSTRSASGVRGRAAAIVLAAVLAYANSLSGPFLFDDENSIVNNRSIRALDTAVVPPRDTPVAGRPVVNLTFAVNFAAGGLEVRGYHVVNVAIHLAAALVLFGIVRRTLLLPRLADRFGPPSANLALATALIWLLHPLQTESVNYLTQRTELLMGLFCLLTLYCSIRSTSQRPHPTSHIPARTRIPRSRPVGIWGSRFGTWDLLAILACALGMLAKESMVTAPVIVLLYDRVFVFDRLRDAFRARRGLYIGLAGTWLVLGGVMASRPRTSVGFDAGTGPWVYLLNQAELVARYLWLSVWPRALVLDYGLPRALTVGDVIMPGAVVVALLAATAVALRYAPALGFLGAWCFITLAPTSSFVPIATEVGAERRMYLPLAALATLLTIAAYRSLRGRGAAVAIAGLCIALGAGTILRNRDYASRLTIARTVVDRRPHGRGHFLLGTELLAAGRRDEGMAQLQLSARDYAGARYALATEMLADGKVEEAVAQLEAFLTSLPTHPSAAAARDMLGRAYLSQRRFGEAAQQFQLIVDTAPSYRGANDDIRLTLGYALAASGRLAEAVPVLEAAVAAKPNDAAARDLLARVRGATSSAPLTNRPN